jgi:hypothetical protein
MHATDQHISAINEPRIAHITVLGRAIELHALRAVLLAYVSTRLLVFLVIFCSSITLPMRPGPFLYASPNNLILDGLIRDDSWWYANIAEHGYSAGDIQTGAQGNVVFFPLYPLLVKMAAALTGNVFLAGVLVSNVAFLLALAYLYGLTRHEFDEETAGRAVFYLAAAPTAVFFSAMYSESVYIALVCATFYYAQRRTWDFAALTGALAAATRNTGVLLALVIVLEGLHQHGVRFRPARLWGDSRAATWRLWREHLIAQLRAALRGWRSLAVAACVPLGLLAYMAYLFNTFGDPLAFIHAQATWGRAAGGAGPTKLISRVIELLNIGPHVWAGQVNPKTLMELLFTIGVAPLVLTVVFKLRPAYAVYTALTFLVPLSTGTVGSMTRYILMLVPCFVLLAHWGRRSWVDRLVLGIFLPLMGYLTVVFSHWYFAG